MNLPKFIAQLMAKLDLVVLPNNDKKKFPNKNLRNFKDTPQEINLQ